MLFRRLRYMITGRIIRFVITSISLTVLLVVILLFAFGVFNQGDVISWALNGTIKIGADVEDKIETGDTDSIAVTDQGVYIDGYQPEDSESLTVDKLIDGFFGFIDTVDEITNGKKETGGKQDDKDTDNNSGDDDSDSSDGEEISEDEGKENDISEDNKDLKEE